MPRKPSEIFTDKELETMRVIWELGEATARQIQDRLSGDRHYNSVMTIIRVLEKKGHLTHRVDGRNHVYSAAQSQEKSSKRILKHLIKHLFDGSAESLVLNLVEIGDLTIKDIEEIRERLVSKDTRED